MARYHWTDVPESLRSDVEQRVGPLEITAVTGGFSPGFAGKVNADAFVKAAPLGGRSGDDYRREAEVVAALPDTVPAPRLRFTEERDGWILLCFDVAPGQIAHEPWDTKELAAIMDALTRSAKDLTPPPINPGTVRDRLPEAGDLPPEALLHFDLRADNCLVSENGVSFVDWGRACAGPAWVDLVCLLLETDGDLDREELFRGHPLGARADQEQVDGFIDALVRYWTRAGRLPPIEHAPGLRERQAKSGAMAVDWQRSRQLAQARRHHRR